MDLEKLAIASLANGSVCAYIVNNPKVVYFDSTAVSTQNPQIVNPNSPLYASVIPGSPPVVGPVVAQVYNATAKPPTVPASALTPTLQISSIKLIIDGAPSPMPPPATNVTFTGKWEIAFDPTPLVRPLHALDVATTLTVDTTAPTKAKITGCQTSGATGIAGCHATPPMIVKGYNPKYCTYYGGGVTMDCSATAFCPAGENVTGGGGGCHQSTPFDSTPLTTPPGWSETCESGQDSGTWPPTKVVTATAYAICCPTQ